jgi:hypothetical protein
VLQWYYNRDNNEERDGRLQGKIPDIIRKHRDPGQFWQFIKYVFYIPEGREYIWQEIRPLTGRAASEDDFAKRARLAQDQHPRIAKDEISTKFLMACGGNA